MESRFNDVLYSILTSPRAKAIVAHIDRLRKFNGDILDIWKLAKPLNSVSAAEGDNSSHSITHAFECSAAESMASAANQRNNGPMLDIQSTVLSSIVTDVPIKEGTQPVFTGGFDTASQSSHPPAVRGDVNRPRLASSAARVTGACDGGIGSGAGPVNTAYAARFAPSVTYTPSSSPISSSVYRFIGW
jgi:hypothetical protein